MGDRRARLIDDGWTECPECEGKGYVVTEHIRTVAEHHPSCGGGESCSQTCPIPVPYPEYDREACVACMLGLVPPLGMVEAGAKAGFESTDVAQWLPAWEGASQLNRKQWRAWTTRTLVEAQRWIGRADSE